MPRDRALSQAHPDTAVSPDAFCAEALPAPGIGFIDLAAQQDGIRPQLETNLHRVLHHGSYVMGPEVIALIGARPKFVDIDPRTYNIDPNLIEAAIGPKTRAIMPVSLYGQRADMDTINAIAERHGLPVIEDAGQSFGATYKGRRSCALSTIGCTSFFPSKPLGGYGDGGACFTNDDDLALQMRPIMNHGQDKRYSHARLGINGRLDAIRLHADGCRCRH